MGLTKEQRINSSIAFLEANGYKVIQNYDYLIGKWAAFRQEGMIPILHGKVMDVYPNGSCKIKCKNAHYRYPSVNSVIEFCDSKELCYMIKNPN